MTWMPELFWFFAWGPVIWVLVSLFMWVDRKFCNQQYIKGLRRGIDRWCDRHDPYGSYDGVDVSSREFSEGYVRGITFSLDAIDKFLWDVETHGDLVHALKTRKQEVKKRLDDDD